MNALLKVPLHNEAGADAVALFDHVLLAYSARSALMSASKTNGSPSPAWLIAIDPHGRQERSKAFFSNGMDQQKADDKHHRAGYAMNGDRSRFRAARPQND